MTKKQEAYRASERYWHDEPLKFASAYGKSLNPARVILRDLLNKRNHVAKAYVRVSASDVVADIGCGSGEFLDEICETCKSAYGIDYSETMLELARSKARCENVEFLNSDCNPIPLESGVADKVVCLGVVEYVDDIRAFLGELARITTAKGTVVFSAPKTISIFAPVRWSSRFRRGVIDLPPVVNAFFRKEVIDAAADVGLTVTDMKSLWATMWVIRAVKTGASD